MGCEKLPHLFILSKTATLVPEFVVEDLPSGRTAALVPEFAVKGLPGLEQNTLLIMMMIMYIYIYIYTGCKRYRLPKKFS